MLFDSILRSCRNLIGGFCLPVSNGSRANLGRFQHLCVLTVVFACWDGAQAQWITQSVRLKPGWNAVYMHVDAGHTSLDAMTQAGEHPVVEVWRWNSRSGAAQFVNSQEDRILPNSLWTTWSGSGEAPNSLRRMTGNAAYLVRSAATSEFLWEIKGKPRLPSNRWSLDGLNFVGFPVRSDVTSSFADYFSQLPGDLLRDAEVYRYSGDAVGVATPRRLSSFQQGSEFFSRGEAFWVRGNNDALNKHLSPLQIELTHPN